MRGGPAYVGLDLGTSGLKGAVLDETGSVVARATSPYATHHLVPGAAEQDPADWIRSTGAVVAELAQQRDPRSWACIGLTGMIPTLVTLDAEGLPTGPAVTWEDGRAEIQAARMRVVVGEERLYSVTGQRLDARYLLPMFCRLSEEDHVRNSATAAICSAKDYVFLQLTGELATDPSTATGFGCYDLTARSWHQGIVDVVADLLPAAVPRLPALEPSSTVRSLSPRAASLLGLRAGLPVNLGAADSVVGATGLGVTRDGEVAYIAGTSSVLLALSSQLVLDRSRRYLVTPMPGDGMWGLEMDLLATGSGLAWLAQILGSDSVAALGEVARAVEPAQAPVFLPYLGGGEQGALWDPTLRGSLLGLGVHHERSHIARAMLNGIALESRRCLEVIAETGLPHSPLHLSGPGMAASAFSQDLADASRRQVVVAPGATAGSSVLGAAMLAARAVAGATVEQSMREGLESAAIVVEPDEARGRVWDHLFASHELALAALRPLYHSGIFGKGGCS